MLVWLGQLFEISPKGFKKMVTHHIHYIRNSKGLPIGCIAFRDVFGPNDEIYVEYGFSVRNPSDSWNRSLARQIAIGRMIEQPFRIASDPDWNVTRIIEEINLDLPTRKVPTRVRREVSKSLKIRLPF